MKKRINIIRWIIIVFLSVNLLSGLACQQKQEESNYIESYYTPEVFISVDYIFDNDDGIYGPNYPRNF